MIKDCHQPGPNLHMNGKVVQHQQLSTTINNTTLAPSLHLAPTSSAALQPCHRPISLQHHRSASMLRVADSSNCLYGDAETGYGFLFESIVLAEKCINSSRCYRNLHSTFPKALTWPSRIRILLALILPRASRVHKIPRTIYSQPQPVSDHASTVMHSTSSLAGLEQESTGEGSTESTFKAMMECLSDKNSMNLYIEGLPLSINKARLAALVSPYSIRSSRFLQTKLSTPPRIIAFVRLGTCSAAKEMIEGGCCVEMALDASLGTCSAAKEMIEGGCCMGGTTLAAIYPLKTAGSNYPEIG
ncbi:hypothetical protein B0H19DRAFT_1057985 [Mycena capillaripes]|nr:hypothetical protein B0H19DRAFT_1057985 [Mycena capillaripes]